MQRGGQVPVWEAGLLMPRGTESPSPLFLADKGPTLIICNVIVPSLSLDFGPRETLTEGPLSVAAQHTCAAAGVKVQTCAWPKEKERGIVAAAAC